MTVSIIPVGKDDALTLLELSRKTFFDAFAAQNDPADMDLYASKAFTIDKINFELETADSYFYYALIDNDIAGYLKLNFNSAQTDINDPEALEIERIYVLERYQGLKIGRQLMDFAINKAISTGKAYVWLGVWEHNQKAIAFYRSKGFEVFGSHPFKLGGDNQLDLLMKKVI